MNFRMKIILVQLSFFLDKDVAKKKKKEGPKTNCQT